MPCRDASAGRQAPSFYRYKIGNFELTAVSDRVANYIGYSYRMLGDYDDAKV